MTDRFRIEEYGIWDNRREDKKLTWSELCETLNQLYDENQNLNDYLGELEDCLLQEKRKHMDNYYPIPENCDSCTFLGNNGVCGYCKFTLKCYDSEDDLTECGSLPNCPFKNHQQYGTMIDNWESLVRKSAEISKRNIELNEQLAKEMGEKIKVQEELSYMVWEYNKLKQKNFDLQLKVGKECPYE